MERDTKGANEVAKLWATPDAAVMNDSQTPEMREKRKARELAKGYNGNGGGEPLAYQSRMWATPNVPNGGRRMSAQDVVKRGATAQGKRQVGLEMEAEYFRPDPTTPTHGDPSSPPTPDSRPRLNPRFVEWLMGFPDGWTVCEPSETP